MKNELIKENKTELLIYESTRIFATYKN